MIIEKEKHSIYEMRFQMMMGFADSLFKMLGLMPSYALMNGDIHLASERRNVFDELVYELSFGEIDISGMSVHSDDVESGRFEKYVTEKECYDECCRFNNMVLIWKTYCDHDGLHELRMRLMLGKDAKATARKFGVDSALKAFIAGVPLEDIVA